MAHVTARGPQRADALKLSEDRKVSPRGSQQPGGVRAGRWVPGLRNSFGLPPMTTCPGATEWCADVCYAIRSENSAGVGGLLLHNQRLLRAAGSTRDMASLLADAVGRYAREADRLGIDGPQRLFRIHWSGDFFSVDYARAWAMVMRAWPTVQFWAYTRSFRAPVDVVPVLAGVENLALYLSADADNIAAALLQVEQYPSVKLALCAVDYKTARALSPQRRSVVCPENVGRMPLMGPDPDRPGNGVGACVTCRLCPDAKVDVMFSSSHRQDVSLPMPVVRRRPRRPAPAPPARKRPQRVANPLPARCERVCAGPGCDNLLRHPTGPGRPPIYCSGDCKAAAGRERARVAS